MRGALRTKAAGERHLGAGRELADLAETARENVSISVTDPVPHGAGQPDRADGADRRFDPAQHAWQSAVWCGAPHLFWIGRAARDGVTTRVWHWRYAAIQRCVPRIADGPEQKAARWAGAKRSRGEPRSLRRPSCQGAGPRLARGGPRDAPGLGPVVRLRQVSAERNEGVGGSKPCPVSCISSSRRPVFSCVIGGLPAELMFAIQLYREIVEDRLAEEAALPLGLWSPLRSTQPRDALDV